MKKLMKIAEFRANLKSLVEQRNDKVAELQALVDGAKAETRALGTEEMAKFTALEVEIAGIDGTIKAEERARELKLNVVTDDKKKEIAVEIAEERAFDNLLRGIVVENRAGEVNLTKADNGVVIPQTIANKIITTVKDICPVFRLATVYNIKGTLIVPVWGKGGVGADQDIACAYGTEFTDLTANAGKFTSVTLTGFLAGALTLVSKSVVNNSSFNIVSFVIQEMSKKIAEFLEKELLIGTADKMTGLASGTNTLTTAAATAITVDELIKLQMKVKQVYQAGAVWIMAPSTFEAIRLLKDGQGRYLLNQDITAAFGWTLLGKMVYVSDNMPAIAAEAKTIYYGDMSGLTVKVSEQVEIQVLLEKYATSHAIGVVGWMEIDSKITDNQKFAVLVQKA
ncbi:MAG: phage major capsid protein [Chlamydiales bacterium]|nr:phage major capsid protein [Chlamydiales bacterium]